MGVHVEGYACTSCAHACSDPVLLPWFFFYLILRGRVSQTPNLQIQVGLTSQCVPLEIPVSLSESGIIGEAPWAPGICPLVLLFAQQVF